MNTDDAATANVLTRGLYALSTCLSPAATGSRGSGHQPPLVVRARAKKLWPKLLVPTDLSLVDKVELIGLIGGGLFAAGCGGLNRQGLRLDAHHQLHHPHPPCSHAKPLILHSY